MNFEKCAFCKRRIPKKARLDAKYCSDGCRMNALRVRKREKRLADRAATQAKDSGASEAQARLHAQRAAMLTRVQGARLAASLPNLKEDVLLNLHAEVAVCDKLIAYYTERKKVAEAQLRQHREPQASSILHFDVPAGEVPALPPQATQIGVAMQTGEFDGSAMIYTLSPVEKGAFARQSFYHAAQSKFVIGPLGKG